MSYVALYRAWRPNRWEDVVDQKAVVRILRNALSEGKVSHAYLFSGPRGTGKTTVARILAKAVNCENLDAGGPCNKCRTCVSIGEGSSVDVIEIDAASNRGIDEIRSLRESVMYVPVMGHFKVYIIDEVHMLTTEAFNALLKTLEEPPEHVIFILATTAPHKIPLTITSRCQRLDFRRLSIPDIEGQLNKILTAMANPEEPAQEGLPGMVATPAMEIIWECDALRLIARAARGSLRDALSILDLCLTYGGGRVTFDDVREILGETAAETMTRLFTAVAQTDVKAVLAITQEASDRGKDMGEFCEEIAEYARDMLLVRTGGRVADIGRPQDEIQQMRTLAKALSPSLLIMLLEAMAKAAVDIKNQSDPRLTVEMALLGLFLGSGGEGRTVAIESPSRSVEVRLATDTTTGNAVVAVPGAQEAQPNLQSDVPEPANSTQGSGEDLLERVKTSWPSLLETLARGKKMMARAYLLPASPARVEGNKLYLAYPKRFATHMEQIMVPSNKSVVEHCLHRLLKCPLDLQVIVSDLDPRYGGGSNGGGGNGGGGNDGLNADTDGYCPAIQPEALSSSEGDLHPLVKAAITILDGKVVS